MIKIQEAQFVTSAFLPNQIINDSLPKIIFCGRSNVGKSSLINKLLNRKKLAKISSKPGKTVSINYYSINGQFYFVDLPGYGFAKISKTEGLRVEQLISHFFLKTTNIQLVVLLLDCRRGFTKADIEILPQILNKNCKILTVLTKSDKLSFNKLESQKLILQRDYNLHVVLFSTNSIKYKEELLHLINNSLME